MKRTIHKQSLREGHLVSVQDKYFTVLVKYPNGMVYHKQSDIRIIEDNKNDKSR